MKLFSQNIKIILLFSLFLSSQNYVFHTKEIFFNNSESICDNQFVVRNIYTCGWGFEKKIHSQFFPEHNEKLRYATKLKSLQSLENVMETLQNATKHDLFIAGGVHGCIQNELRIRKTKLNQEQWNLWLRENFDGTYILCK